MGIEKNALIEAEERGWTEPKGYVCSNCVDDAYLKEVINDYACHRECDYCGSRTRKHSTAPVAELMELICETVFAWFNNPEASGGFWDSENKCYSLGNEAMSTREMLESLSLECNEQLFEDISVAFVNEEWVETANGSLFGSHPHELMTYAWERFADIVKHELRYFFQQTPSSFSSQEDEYEFVQQENYSPANFLPTLGELVKKLRLFDTLPTGKILFRARPKENGESFDLNARELGAPPSPKARSGRMNPAGISYMYLAFEQETALAEVRQGDLTLQAAIGQFETQRELQILDLTNLPQKPSIFDSQHYEKLVGLFFIDEFVNEIIKPIEKDGSEHIEYAPSQVVSEYFAMVLSLGDGKQLDGIKYPSSIRTNNYNLVLFPTERGFKPVFNQVVFNGGWDC